MMAASIEKRLHISIAFVLFVAVLESIGFYYAFNQVQPKPYDDTREYQRVARHLREFDFSILITQSRPATYPLVLIASEKLGVKATAFAAALNPLAATIAVLTLPTPASVAMSLGYLTLNASSAMLTYQNSLLTESILPFVLMLAWIIGIHARRKWYEQRYFAWAALSIFEGLWLISLKPAFKAYIFLCVLWMIATTFKNTRRLSKKSIPAILGVFLILGTINEAVLKRSGGKDLASNKRVILTEELLPALTPQERSTLSPELLDTYDLIKFCNHLPPKPPRCPREVSNEIASRLYDHLVAHHFWEFLTTQTARMLRVTYQSAWGIDYGRLEKKVGIPRGFGFWGILFITSCLGASMLIYFGRNISIPSEFTGELTCLVIYGWLIQLVFCAADSGRYSLPWLIPAFPLLVLLWWKFWRAMLIYKTKA